MENFSEFWTQFGETITQIITFLIFFWMMKRFAWGPLVQILDARQAKIEEGFSDIERRQAEAEKLHDDYAAHLKNIEAEAREKVQEAVNEGRRVANELTENARKEAEEIRLKAEQSIQLELHKARVELRDDVAALVLQVSEKLMREKLDGDADRKLIAGFIQDLEEQR